LAIKNPVFSNLRLGFAHFSRGHQKRQHFCNTNDDAAKKVNSNDDLTKMNIKLTPGPVFAPAECASET